MEGATTSVWIALLREALHEYIALHRLALGSGVSEKSEARAKAKVKGALDATGCWNTLSSELKEPLYQHISKEVENLPSALDELRKDDQISVLINDYDYWKNDNAYWKFEQQLTLFFRETKSIYEKDSDALERLKKAWGVVESVYSAPRSESLFALIDRQDASDYAVCQLRGNSGLPRLMHDYSQWKEKNDVAEREVLVASLKLTLEGVLKEIPEYNFSEKKTAEGMRSVLEDLFQQSINAKVLINEDSRKALQEIVDQLGNYIKIDINLNSVNVGAASRRPSAEHVNASGAQHSYSRAGLYHGGNTTQRDCPCTCVLL